MADLSFLERLHAANRVVDGLGRERILPSPLHRLEARLDKSSGPEDCWPFLGSRSPKGYGRLHVNWAGGVLFAHRLAYMAYRMEEIPAGLLVLHSCDNPPCCNPAHLRIGTAADNSQDMVLRGRAPQTANERSGRAKLKSRDVEDIRQRYAAGETQTALAKEFGVHPAHVSRIVNMRRRPVEQKPESEPVAYCNSGWVRLDADGGLWPVGDAA